MIPAIFTPVLNLIMCHTNELIRKKCCMVLHALYRIQPQLVIAEARDVTRYVMYFLEALCSRGLTMLGIRVYFMICHR